MACIALLLVVLTTDHALGQDRLFPYAVGKQDVVMLPLGLGLTALGSSLKDGHDPITREEIERLSRSDVNWFDRTATHNRSSRWAGRSDTYRDIDVRATFVLLAAEATYTVVQKRWVGPAVLGIMFAEVYFFVNGATDFTKGLVGRKRPYVYNTALSVEERYEASGGTDVFFSFFSGHTTAAFVAATFSSKVFTDIHGTSPWSYLMWGSTLSLATLTAYARVKAGEHYPSDVIAGAVVGGAIGYLVPALHRKDAGGRLSLVAAPGRMGLQLRF
jgi:membrane-associated phospholipid phosphatase